MFLHLLSDKSQVLFLEIAHLVGISDSQLLWDGKTESELTGETDLSKVSTKECEHEKIVLEGFARECGQKSSASATYGSSGIHRLLESIYQGSDDVWVLLKSQLKSLPLNKQNDPEERIKAAVVVLGKLFPQQDKLELLPAEPKVMLYELFLLALADGEISIVEEAVLKNFASQFQIEDYLYDDLLERAKSMSRESVKTLSLILE